MIVTLKTLQQQTFKIEIGPEETVKVLKEKIENEKGAETFPAAGQKLIYAGKILEDDKVVSTYKIEEKNFVVVMVTKPKPAPTPAPAPTTESAAPVTPTTQATTTATDTTPKPDEKMETDSTTTQSTTAPSESTSATSATSSASSEVTATESSVSGTSISSDSSAESALVTGQAYEDVVSQMVNMGFPRDQVQRALRASFNNPDRAVEYLFSGIPDMPAEEPPAQQAPPVLPTGSPAPTGTTAPATGTPAPAPTTGTTAAPTAPASGTGQLVGPPAGSQLSGEDALAFLRNQPQFQHMRLLIQQNPQLLPELLQQIGRSNPQLLQMISQNQEQFISMLNEQSEGGESAGQGAGGPAVGAPGEPGGPGYIQVTQQEKEAIERLKQLGFSEGMCIQAYFACEKNEELAANYLLSHGFDDDDS